MAPLNFSLQDYTTWTAADALASQQLAWVRAKIHPSIPGVTYGTLWAAANSTSSNIVVNSGWLQEVRLVLPWSPATQPSVPKQAPCQPDATILPT
jgi:hypothetical protein